MATEPDANVNEWIDEQAGMLMKFGLPVLQVARMESLGSAGAMVTDGLLLQIPGPNTSAQALNIIGLAAVANRGVLLSGRADHIHGQLLELAGAKARAEPVVPTAMVNASLAIRPAWASASPQQTLHLSSRLSVETTNAGVVQARVTSSSGGGINGSAVMVSAASHPSIVWAQLNDLGGGEDVSVASIGTPGVYQATAALLNAASRTVLISKGINATHPATLHAWRSEGTVKVLIGNLEGAYFGGKLIPGTSFGFSSGCSIPIHPQGGFAGGTRLTLEIQLSPTAMGLENTEACAWSLRCLDGMRGPIWTNPDTQGVRQGFVVFEPIHLAPREAHAFELRCDKRSTHPEL